MVPESMTMMTMMTMTMMTMTMMTMMTTVTTTMTMMIGIDMPLDLAAILTRSWTLLLASSFLGNLRELWRTPAMVVQTETEPVSLPGLQPLHAPVL